MEEWMEEWIEEGIGGTERWETIGELKGGRRG